MAHFGVCATFLLPIGQPHFDGRSVLQAAGTDCRNDFPIDELRTNDLMSSISSKVRFGFASDDPK